MRVVRVERVLAGPSCPACGARLVARHCEYVCPNHGAVYDCSDPFGPR